MQSLRIESLRPGKAVVVVVQALVWSEPSQAHKALAF